MLVGHADLPLLHLALAPEHGLAVHLDDGACVVVVLVRGDDLDGGVGGDLQLAVLDHVVLALLVDLLTVVGGDGHDALDGVQEGLDVALVQEHDGLLDGGRAAEDVLHSLDHILVLDIQAELILDGGFGGDLLGGGLLGGDLLGGGLLGGLLGRLLGGLLSGGGGGLRGGILDGGVSGGLRGLVAGGKGHGGHAEEQQSRQRGQDANGFVHVFSPYIFTMPCRQCVRY